MATKNMKKSTSDASGANEMRAVASLALLAKIHADVRADINPDLLDAIREHEVAHAAWLATSDGDLPVDTMEEKAADRAERKFIHFPCHSHADVLAKVGYLYPRATEAARAVHNIVQTDYLDEFLGSLVAIDIGESPNGLVEPVPDPPLEATNVFRTEPSRLNAKFLDSNEAAQVSTEGTDTNRNPYEIGPFRHVSDMETPLTTIADILHGMAFIAETMDDDHGRVVQRMAWLAISQCKAAERLRGELFHLTHPRREHFEKEGWPS